MESPTTTSKLSKQKYWSNQIACWKKSGLTQREYCSRQAIALSTFSYWKKKLRQGTTKLAKQRFYPLTVKEPSISPKGAGGKSGIRLSTGEDKFKIDLEKDFSESTLRRLIAFLEKI